MQFCVFLDLRDTLRRNSLVFVLFFCAKLTVFLQPEAEIVISSKQMKVDLKFKTKMVNVRKNYFTNFTGNRSRDAAFEVKKTEKTIGGSNCVAQKLIAEEQ